MHTFIKNSGGGYDVGMWLLSFQRPGTHQFTPLVTVDYLRSAMRVVNLLNGGTGNIEATLLRAGVLKDAAKEATNGEDHEGTARSAAVVQRSRT